MTKKLVFNFYLTKNCIDSEVNRLHLRCLEIYSHIFDEMLFVLSLDDVNDLETIRTFQDRLLKLHTKGTITFSIVKNNELRESATFKREIVDKMPEEKLVFFAHNKGVTNINDYEKDSILYWIVGMYFFSLNYMDEVETLLVQRPMMSYGSMLTKNTESSIKYHWAYIGTYFWINSGILYDYIKHFNIELPHCTNRFYDEEFLGNVYPIDYYAKSHGCRYILEGVNYYLHAREYIEIIYGTAGLDEFNEFYDKIINELNITL